MSAQGKLTIVGEAGPARVEEDTPAVVNETEQVAALVGILKEWALDVHDEVKDGDAEELQTALGDAAITIESLWNKAFVLTARLNAIVAVAYGQQDQNIIAAVQGVS